MNRRVCSRINSRKCCNSSRHSHSFKRLTHFCIIQDLNIFIRATVTQTVVSIKHSKISHDAHGKWKFLSHQMFFCCLQTDDDDGWWLLNVHTTQKGKAFENLENIQKYKNLRCTYTLWIIQQSFFSLLHILHTHARTSYLCSVTSNGFEESLKLIFN